VGEARYLRHAFGTFTVGFTLVENQRRLPAHVDGLFLPAAANRLIIRGPMTVLIHDTNEGIEEAY
jgi:hypothetical protein